MILAAAILFVAAGGAHGSQCKDENGDDVDWFYVYKFPMLPYHDNWLVQQGLGYAYVTSNGANADWTLSEESVGSPQSVVGKTLAPLYDAVYDQFHIMYNDDPPEDKPKSTFALSKGVLFGKGNSSGWLVHSVPNFPPAPLPVSPYGKSSKKASAWSLPTPNGYGFPPEETAFGHMFMCMSLEWNDQNVAKTKLVFDRTLPRLYSMYLNGSGFPEVSPFLNGVKPRKPKIPLPGEMYATRITTVAGKDFVIYTKPKYNHQDIYAYTIAPSLDESMVAQTWRGSGSKLLPAYCTTDNQVNNVAGLLVTLGDKGEVRFGSTLDKSKWAVTASEREIVCVADHDRNGEHAKRGGGAICTEDGDLWNMFQAVIEEKDSCMLPYDY